MSVLEKASELIDCLGQAGEPVSLAYVRSALDMPKSSTHRLLARAGGPRHRPSDGGRTLLARPSPPVLGRGRGRDVRPAVPRRAGDAPPAGRRGRERAPLRPRPRHAHLHRGRRGAPRAPTVHPARPTRCRCARAPPASSCWPSRTTISSGSSCGARTERCGRASRTPRARDLARAARADPRRALGDVGRRARERRGGGRHADRRLARPGRRRPVHLRPDDAAEPRAPRPRCASRSRTAPPRSAACSGVAEPAGAQSTGRPVELAEQLLLRSVGPRGSGG